MERNHNTKNDGSPFDQATINAVWEKGVAMFGYNPDDYRKDVCDEWITKASYGKTDDFGWEIDHIKPVAKGGTDDLDNLQPLHWKNNRGKGDDWPQWSCTVKDEDE